MEVSYQRSASRSYMILSGEEGEDGYEQEMLRQNSVRLLLSFYMVELDRGMQVWYDITGLRSLKDIVRTEGVTIENLYMAVSSIARGFSLLSQYLIRDENILMDPGAVYFDREDKPNVRLCYCPLLHESPASQLLKFFEFYMDQVDDARDQVARLVYRLYEMCRNPVTIDELAETIRKEMETADPVDMMPSTERMISIREEEQGQAKPIQNDVIKDETPADPPVSKKRADKPSLSDKLKGLLMDKFPGITRLLKKERGSREEKKEAFDIADDFVFDPDTELRQKTVFMRKADAAVEQREAKDHFEGLLVYEGKGTENNYQIQTRRFRIGSQEGENDAVLHSAVVSRHHAVITREDGDFYIEDLNSTNGTYLNGELLSYNKRQRLNRMDRIVFADVAYHIV